VKLESRISINETTPELEEVYKEVQRQAVLMTGDERARFLSVEDHWLMYASIFDPDEESGVILRSRMVDICKLRVPVRLLKYCKNKQLSENMDMQERVSGEEIYKKLVLGSQEIGEIGRNMIDKFNDGEGEFYWKSVAKMFARVYVDDRPPMDESITYCFDEAGRAGTWVQVQGIGGRVKLGRRNGGVVELACGLRGVKTASDFNNKAEKITLLDKNKYIIKLIENYIEMSGNDQAKAKVADVTKDNLLNGEKTLVAIGLHHLNDGELSLFINNVANNLRKSGGGSYFYYRDSLQEEDESRMKGIRGEKDIFYLIKKYLKENGLSLERQVCDRKQMHFELVATV